MPLTASPAKAAAPKDKDYKLSDEKGLFLLVRENDGKTWCMRYRHQGKENLLALGVFPEVTLPQARVQQKEAGALLRSGADPSQARQDIIYCRSAG